MQPPMKTNSPDDFQTPPEALTPLFPYLKKEWTIWEPSCGNGNLVEAFDKHGYKVFGTDILDEKGNRDFLQHGSPQHYDYQAVITNPPYSGQNKYNFLKRCYDLGKPFALLLPITVLGVRKCQTLFAKQGIEIIFFPRRINFETPNHEQMIAEGRKSSAYFATAWFTHGLNIGKELTFSE